MSGVWERMIRSAKNVLKVILGTQVVTRTEHVLQTLLTEVEQALNGRALTANSDDPNDLLSLPPACFLMQRKCICFPPGVFAKADQYHRRKWTGPIPCRLVLEAVVAGVSADPASPREMAQSPT